MCEACGKDLDANVLEYAKCKSEPPHQFHRACGMPWANKDNCPRCLPPDCSICMLEMDPFHVKTLPQLNLAQVKVLDWGEDESTTRAKCGHLFHQKCLLHWVVEFKNKTSNPTCPTCRAVILKLHEARPPAQPPVDIPRPVPDNMDRVMLEGALAELQRGGALGVPDPVPDEAAAFLLQCFPNLELEDGFLRVRQGGALGGGAAGEPRFPGLYRLFGSLGELSEGQRLALAGSALLGVAAMALGYRAWCGAPLTYQGSQTWFAQLTAAEQRSYTIGSIVSVLSGVPIGLGVGAAGCALTDHEGSKGRWVKRWASANGVVLIVGLSFAPPLILYSRVCKKLYGVDWLLKNSFELPGHAGLVRPLGLFGAIIGGFGASMVWLSVAEAIGQSLPQRAG